MPGVGGAVVSTPSLCRCLSTQPDPLPSHPPSFVTASPFPRIGLQRKCFRRPRAASYRSSHFGTSPRFPTARANLGQSFSSSCRGLLPEKSAEEEVLEEDPSSSSMFRPEELSGFVSDGNEDFSVCLNQFSSRRNLAVLGTGVFFLGSAGAALAEVIDVTPPDGGAKPSDYLLSFLFGGAFLGLSILTIGVVYLSVSDFLENRQRTEMQKAAGQDKREERDKSETVKVGGPKGFGTKKVEKKTEKGK